MLLWIKAAAVTVLRWVVAVLVVLAAGLIYLAVLAGGAVIIMELGYWVVAVPLLVTAFFGAWIFVDDVRDNHERLLCKARLEESARGGDGA